MPPAADDQVSPGGPPGAGHAGQPHELVLDPDLDIGEELGQAWAGTASRRRGGLPRERLITVAVVILGGFLGGLARYELGLAWATPAGAFPWATWIVNTAGAFILGLLLVMVLEVLPPTRYVRALVGTGFCGGLTTFSSVTTSVDQLAAHGHVPLAVGYVLASLVAGLAAASLGILFGRSVAAYGERRK